MAANKKMRFIAAALAALPAAAGAAQAGEEQALPEVKVQAAPEAAPGAPPPPYAGGQVGRGGRAGLLGDKDFLDTPFNAQSYTQELIQNQQARTIADVVANDPSVRVLKAFGTYADAFFIRGFAVNNDDVAYGALYGILPRQIIPAEIIERVEVLKGPNAFLNGIAPGGTIGGAINIVPKRAPDRPLTQLTASYYSDGQIGAHLDVGRRFGPDNGIGLRFNGVYRQGDTPVDRESRELALGVVGADFRSERVRLSTDFGYTDNDIYQGLLFVRVAAAAPVPRVPDASSNYVQPWVSYGLEDAFGVLRGELDLTPDFTAYAAIGQRRSNEVSVLASPTVTNAAGDYTAGRTNIGNYEERVSSEIGLRGRLRTAGIGHQINVAATHVHVESGFFFNFGAGFTSNLYNPVFVPPPNFSGASRNRPRRNEGDLSSLAVADTLSFADERVALTLGVRQQQVKVEGFAASGAQTAFYDEDALTPAVGLVVKPLRNVSVYGNYVEGLTQGPTAPLNAANAGAIFAPFKSKQYEAGLKVDFGRIATTLSAFQITQPSAFTDPTTNIFGLDGEQRNRGLELNVFGEPYKGIRVLGGITFIEGELTRTAGGTNDDNTPVGVPDTQLNLGGEWDLASVPGATLTARVIHTSSQFLNPTNTKSISEWTRFDVGARYATRMGGRPLTLRASVENLFDKSYWASAAAGYLSIGAPRAVLLSATMDF